MGNLRFTIRELLLLIVVVALLMPYLYRGLFSTKRLNLGWQVVKGIVQQIEPSSRVSGGSGTSDSIEFTCQMPLGSKQDFSEKFRTKILEHVEREGWRFTLGNSKYLANEQLVSFQQEVSNGVDGCTIFYRLIESGVEKDVILNRDIEWVRFVLLSPQTR